MEDHEVGFFQLPEHVTLVSDTVHIVQGQTVGAGALFPCITLERLQWVRPNIYLANIFALTPPSVRHQPGNRATTSAPSILVS